MSLQNHTAVDALQRHIAIRHHDNVLTLDPRSLDAVQRYVLLGLDAETFVNRRNDPVGLGQPNHNPLDSRWQSKVWIISGEVVLTGFRVLHLEILDLREARAILQHVHFGLGALVGTSALHARLNAGVVAEQFHRLIPETLRNAILNEDLRNNFAFKKYIIMH